MKSLAVGFSILISSCFAGAFETAPSMIFVGSTYSGHEEITRQALNNISKKIIDVGGDQTLFELSDLKFDLKPEPMGLFGYKSKNLVIHGNFASDFPKQTNVLNLAEFWKNKDFSGFENADNQVIHFLRNYKDSKTLDSAYNTCILARQNIKHVTAEALKAWQVGDKSKALFLIGHTTHMIQDSFSPAHTQRADDEHNNNLLNVCFFGVQIEKTMDMRSRNGRKDLCYHAAPDSRDAIWNSSPDQYKKALSNWGQESVSQCDKNQNYPQSEEAKQSCLKDEGRLARIATEKYLFLVFSQIAPQNTLRSSDQAFIDSFDSRLFDGPVGDSELDKKMANGIMRCENLSTEIIYGSEPTQLGNISK